jgi:hypothetical protein
MAYYKVKSAIEKSLPLEKESFKFSEEQLDKLKSAAEIGLAVVAAVGILALSVVAPNLLQVLDKVFFKKSNKNWSNREKRQKTIQTFYYLKRHNLIRFKPHGKNFLVSLTEKGQRRLRRLNFNLLTIPKKSRWDKKWWQVAADIPTKEYRVAADMFRKKIKDLNFFSLQRTLWFYPFDPRREIEFLANYYTIGNFVTVMEISRLDKDDEAKLTAHFKKIQIL